MEYPRFTVRKAALDVTLLCIAAFAARDMGWTALGLLGGGAIGHFTAMFMIHDWRGALPCIGMIIGLFIGMSLVG